MGILEIPPTKTAEEIKSIVNEFLSANHGLARGETVVLRKGLIWNQYELENDQ